jgi:hypothetical protein
MRDQALADCLDARCWGFGELQHRRWWSSPSWFDESWLPKRQAGYQRWLGLLVAAYRAGAAGVLVSYEEAMAICGVRSRATWRRWTQEMEALGLVRISQTWVEDRDHVIAGRRRYGRLLYRIGPAIEDRGGLGLLEGCEGMTPAKERWAARVAAGARAKARKARRKRKRELWSEARPSAATRDVASAAAPAESPAGVQSAPCARAPGEAVHFKNFTPPRPSVGASGAPAEGQSTPPAAFGAAGESEASPATPGMLSTSTPPRRPRHPKQGASSTVENARQVTPDTRPEHDQRPTTPTDEPRSTSQEGGDAVCAGGEGGSAFLVWAARRPGPLGEAALRLVRRRPPR